MSKNLKLYFTNKNIGGDKNIFKLLDNKELNTNYKISSIPFLKMFTDMMKKNNNSKNNSKNIYNKGSETKKYYDQLKIK